MFGSNLLCSFASAANLATGSRSAVSPASHLPRMGVSFMFLFFPGSLLFLCAIFKVVWMGNQPAAEVAAPFSF